MSESKDLSDIADALGGKPAVANQPRWIPPMLATLSGKTELGHAEISDGIVFFDMDLLDLPTIGAFV